MSDRVLLVFGATGSCGAQLVPQALEHGYRVRAVQRDPSKINKERFSWADSKHLEVVQASSNDEASMRAAFKSEKEIAAVIVLVGPPRGMCAQTLYCCGRGIWQV